MRVSSLAPEAEYKKRLADWLTDAYCDALLFVDPATATETDVRDAFRKYIPTGQQARMVSLFMGLFTAAGVMPERERKVAPERLAAWKWLARPTRRYGGVLKSKNRRMEGAGMERHRNGGLPPALAGMVASLAAEGSEWSVERRDEFVRAFRGLMDFCFPVGAANAAPAQTMEMKSMR